MRGLPLIGIVLIVLGIIGLCYNVIPFHHREEVAKIGPLTATRDKETDVYIPPIAGVIAVLAGGALIFAARRQV